MALATDTFGILQENLVDAGCDDETIDKCMTLAKNNQWTECIPILTAYRKRLLNTIHAEQDKLDCLDFLKHRIQKEYKNK